MKVYRYHMVPLPLFHYRMTVRAGAVSMIASTLTIQGETAFVNNIAETYGEFDMKSSI